MLFDVQHAVRIDGEIIGRFALAYGMALAELGIVHDVQGFRGVFDGVFGVFSRKTCPRQSRRNC